MGLLIADGDGRTNRFGYNNDGDSTDRILFATKPLEGFKPKEERDLSRDRGLIYAMAYDRIADGEIRHVRRQSARDRQLGAFPRPQIPPSGGRSSFRRCTCIAGNASSTPMFMRSACVRSPASIAWRRVSRDVYLFGETREVAEALARLRPGDPIRTQRIEQWGARAVVRWDDPTWTAYLEFDFASGDPDPDPGTPLTQMTWAEDTNVGLLMFERILAFESARSAGSGTALLRTLDAPTNPAESVDTEGSFTNAVALFPQFDLRPIKRDPAARRRAGRLGRDRPGGSDHVAAAARRR